MLALIAAAVPTLASAAPSTQSSIAWSPDIVASISGTLAPGTEQDWGPYFLTQGQSLTVSLDWTPGSVPMAVDLCDPNNDCTHVPVSGGSVAGLLLGVNQYIPQYQNMLNSVANDLATTVNNQLAAGYTATGVSGATEPLFVGTGAAGIAVNSAVAADPTLLAAASTTGAAAANDGSNAQAMAELGTVPTGPDAAYQNLVQSIGTLTQWINSQVASQSAVATQADQALQAVSGVDQNKQLTDLLQFQQVYQASAKLLSIVDSTIQSLLAAV
jgi:flagellar hook-associated protein 1 FlgK